jgi:hypothetical protein
MAEFPNNFTDSAASETYNLIILWPWPVGSSNPKEKRNEKRRGKKMKPRTQKNSPRRN